MQEFPLGRLKISMAASGAQKGGTSRERFGWGGWTRTNTVLINSEVSYQLDHAPIPSYITMQTKDLLDIGGIRLHLLG